MEKPGSPVLLSMGCLLEMSSSTYTGGSGCSASERTVLRVRLPSLGAIFTAFCAQMAQNNKLVIHLSPEKYNSL